MAILKIKLKKRFNDFRARPSNSEIYQICFNFQRNWEEFHWPYRNLIGQTDVVLENVKNAVFKILCDARATVCCLSPLRNNGH